MDRMAAMAISLSTIASVFSPKTGALAAGRGFLDSLGGSDPITDGTLALGHALADALGNAQINRIQGGSTIAANAAIKRIHDAIVAKQKAALAAEAVLDALIPKTSKKTASSSTTVDKTV